MPLLNSLDNSRLLEKLDATKPFFDLLQISYRYPSLDGGIYIAQGEYTGWDVYQGNVMSVAAAVDRLIGKRLDDMRDLTTIRSHRDGINANLDKAVKDNIEEVRGQQRVLSDEERRSAPRTPPSGAVRRFAAITRRHPARR